MDGVREEMAQPEGFRSVRPFTMGIIRQVERVGNRKLFRRTKVSDQPGIFVAPGYMLYSEMKM
jgi:RPA family protein